MSIGYYTPLDPMELILEAWDTNQEINICLTTPSSAYQIMGSRPDGLLMVGWADEIDWVPDQPLDSNEEIVWPED